VLSGQKLLAGKETQASANQSALAGKASVTSHDH
jgi:hypothetical protein